MGFLEAWLTDKTLNFVGLLVIKSADYDTKMSDFAIFYIESLAF